ncbi:MAG: ABC transporter ATP-binding protein [Thermodesulfobacteria bacterium]|nr:ABC transporter ATP-binding protein [Thermodesulfobacteriota bacterium]
MDQAQSWQDDFCIEVSGLTKTFGSDDKIITALDNCSFKVKSGMVTGLIGPDGAGKTTFMRLCAGLLVPDEGEIKVLGMDAVRDFLKVQSNIRYMPQRFGLYEDLTVQENLDLYSDLLGIPKERRQERYEILMRMTGLAPFKQRLAGRLSGGMKQKLGLACTLIKPPRLLILDEPTVGVDPVSRRELWEIVYSQVEEEGMSVLLSTAYLDEAERCQEVILMHEGHTLGQGVPSEFSQKLDGHCFMLDPGSIPKRSLQRELANRDEVIDCIILGEKIRLVTIDTLDSSQVKQIFQLPDEVEVAHAPPRFEDAFIWLLKERLISLGRDVKLKVITHKKISDLPDEDIIVVKNLKRRFGNFYAVNGISFTVKRGEVFGLLGANGAGKTTTFRMLCGLLPASEGELYVAGENLRKARAKARERIGYMAQKFSLYVDLTVIQNLNFFSSAYGLYGKKQRERVEWALDAFDLRQEANTLSRDLPLGFKQRLALAAALMHEPDILFLDEPTSGVDPLARRQFWAHINSLADAGVTIMVTTHFMEEAEYCDRIVIMKRGKILAEGTPEELKKKYHPPGVDNPTMEDTFITLIEMKET